MKIWRDSPVWQKCFFVFFILTISVSTYWLRAEPAGQEVCTTVVVYNEELDTLTFINKDFDYPIILRGGNMSPYVIKLVGHEFFFKIANIDEDYHSFGSVCGGSWKRVLSYIGSDEGMDAKFYLFR